MGLLGSVFEFGTKSENLNNIKGKLTSGKIMYSYTFLVSEWRSNFKNVLRKIESEFNNRKIIIRSSAPNEDTVTGSSAGLYKSVLNVDGSSPNEIKNAITNIIESYDNKNSENKEIEKFQIFVQEMLENVTSSGVVFTKDFDGSPYYVIEIDNISGKTDTVTGGYENNIKKFKVVKNIEFAECINLLGLPNELMKIVAAANEIECITGTDSLDIEWGIKDNILYIFQVRPLLSNKITFPKEILQQIDILRDKTERILVSKEENTFGGSTVLSDMTDWNPAELIGIRPNPLAYSLYSEIITNNVWRKGRGMLGYYDPKDCKLMCEIGGHPFIDVRKDFNSFLPEDLPDNLKDKLINFYIKKLSKNPELHDKVEFEIVLSCLTFDFDSSEKEMVKYGFNKMEIDLLRSKLWKLTDEIITDKRGILNEMECRVKELISIGKQISFEEKIKLSDIPSTIKNYVEKCIYYGTIPFTVFVRGAFIGTDLLKSLKNIGVISGIEFEKIHSTIETVASQYQEDLNKLIEGNVSREVFIGKYGHLRPGTYDITSPSYKEILDFIIPINTIETRNTNEYLSLNNNNVDMYLSDYNFSFDFTQLLDFTRYTMYKREEIKLEFTKLVSYVLELIKEIGTQLDIPHSDLAYVELQDIINLDFFKDENYNNWKKLLIQKINTNKEKEEINKYIKLPDFICASKNIDIISSQIRKPNFVTSKSIIGKLIYLDNERISSADSLYQKIVLIDNADPGFDWIFAHNISGLVTKYGGAASHMAIRCSEFGIPAAIGCGDGIFNELRKSDFIFLDCEKNKIKMLAEWEL